MRDGMGSESIGMGGSGFHGTTILCVRRGGVTALGGDGQVTTGATVMKSGAVKIRRLQSGRVLAGFAGAVADALTLFDRFEAKLGEFSSLRRAAVELAKDWRSDRYLRRLEALLIAADAQNMLLLSGTGEVIEPDPAPGAQDTDTSSGEKTAPASGDACLAVGSGGSFALAAARALLAHTSLSAVEIVRESMGIAADLCIYTNRHITIEETTAEVPSPKS